MRIKNVFNSRMLVAAVAVLFTVQGMAQATFKEVWKSSFDNKANMLSTAASDGYQVIGSTKQNVCVLDGNNGKVKWSGKYKDMVESKTCEIQYYMEDAGVIFLYDKRMGQDYMICLDAENGKELWKNSTFEGVKLSSIIYMADIKSFAIVTKNGLVMIDARSGQEKWSVKRFRGSIARYSYDQKNGKLLLVNFKTGWGAIFALFENQIMQVDARSGNVDWVSTYDGIIETKLVTGEPLVSFNYTDDKVLLFLNGLEVFDRKSGNLIWKTHYDVSLNRGIGGSKQMYEAVADPLVVGPYVYVPNFSSRSRKKVLQKFDLATGKLLWESEEIDGRKTIIPRLTNVGGSVVLQIGGYVNIQWIEHTKDGDVYHSQWKWQGPFGLKGYDENSGAFVWKSEKYKDRITNLTALDNKIFVADGKNLYALDPKTGEPKFTTAMKAVKIGKPQWVFTNNDKVFALGEGGLASFNTTDGSKQFAYKAKKTLMTSDFVGNNYFLRTSKMLVGIDLNTGTEKGRYKYAKGAKTSFTADGEFMFLMSKKGVTKYKING